jgi:tetratricopeptide (TPR) repeat protein
MTSESASGHSDARRQVLLAAAVVAIAFAAYIPAMRGGFCWDDSVFLTQNKCIKAPDGLRRFWFTAEPQDYFPLTSSMLWIEWRLWGPRATGYHIVNVLLHAAAAVLLWRVLRRLKIPGAWLAGVLFAVHPVAAASAAWITEGKNTLPMVLYLLALLAWLRFENGSPNNDGTTSTTNGTPQSALRSPHYLISLALFLLALLAKTSVVMLPAILLLCAWWRRGRVTWKDLLRSAPFFGLSLALGLVTVWFQHHNAIAGAAVRPEGVASRIAAAGWIAWFYLYKALLPVGLCVIYPRWDVGGSSILAFAPLALFIAGMAWLWMRRKSWGRPSDGTRGGPEPFDSAHGRMGRGPLFALAYFAISLLPVLGFADMAFMQYSLVADHLQYVAMIGVIAFAAAVIAQAVASCRSPGWAAVPVGGCVIALGILTWGRGALYGDEARLWEDNLSRNPACWAAWNNLGLLRKGEARYDEAIACFEHALKLCPARAYAYYNNRGLARAGMGRYAPALDDFTKSIENNPDFVEAYVSRSAAYGALGRYEEALGDCERAIQLNPSDARPYHNRGIIRAAGGQYDLALADYDRALALDAEDAETWQSRGLAHTEIKRFDLAIADFGRAISLKPGYVEAHYYRGRADLETKQYADAIRDYSAVIALNPKSAEAYKNRAIAWAFAGRREEAERDLTQAIVLKPDYALAYYTRAQLYFELKKYPEALADVRIFEKLGGHPDADFLKSLTEAARRAP